VKIERVVGFAEVSIRENNHLPLKPITNEQAIVVVGDKIFILGKE